MQKMKNGVLVDLTAEEIAARQAAESAVKSALIANHLIAYRNTRINEGITVSGVATQTDDLTQQRIMAARILAKEDANYTVNWKTANGFVTLNAIQIIAVADAIRAHVQKCFDAEAALNPADYDTIEELETAFDEAYDGQ